MTHKVRKRGFPVLAYAVSAFASPVSLSLLLKCKESPPQASLSLQSSLPVCSADDGQIITLQYECENLAACALGRPSMLLPQTQLDDLTRSGSPQIRMLSLSLRKVCQVWHLPASSTPLTPKPGRETLFHQLSSLAQATRLYIVFDYSWIPREARTVFEQLVKDPEQLSTIPLDWNFAKKYRRGDWTIFSSLGEPDANASGAVASDGDAPTEDEEPPPSYAEARSKRARQISTSPTRTPPPPKRVLLSPFLVYPPGSPTELATPSPKPPYSPTALAQQVQSAVAEAIAAFTSTKEAISEASTYRFPSSQDFERAVEKTVSAILPRVLGALLPSLLAVPPPPSPSSPAPATSKPSSSTELSSLWNLLSARVARQAETQLQAIYDDTISRAADLRNTADEEFLEGLDEKRLDLVVTKDDLVDEMDRTIDTKCGEFREQVSELASDCLSRLANGANQVCDDVCGNAQQRIEDFAKEEMQRIKREKGWLDWEKEVWERDKRKFEAEQRALECGTAVAVARSRRAGSAPA